MIETPPRATAGPTEHEAPMQGRQLFAYYGLLFLFLILGRELLIELNSRFDLAVFPKLAAGIQQALDDAAEFDNVLNTIYSLMYAFLFSLPVAIVYRVTKDEEQFDPALGQTIVLLAMVVTAVMIVISGDLARAFGLAGVVAAVRFRNTLDDAKDAVYVFLAIAIGMACGAGVYSIAVWTSLIMTSTLYLMSRYRFAQRQGQILTSRGGGKKGKDRKDKKGKDDRKGGDEHIPLPPLSAEAQNRMERLIEQQRRLVLLASMSREPGEKKSNAGLVVEAREVSGAQKHVEDVLARSSGKWHLANVIAREGGAGTLEFVGRLSKSEEPSALVQVLLAGATALIDTVQFRSLKEQKGALLGEDPAKAVAPTEEQGA